eukprot:124175-Rhodomonas_salina.1
MIPSFCNSGNFGNFWSFDTGISLAPRVQKLPPTSNLTFHTVTSSKAELQNTAQQSVNFRQSPALYHHTSTISGMHDPSFDVLITAGLNACPEYAASARRQLAKHRGWACLIEKLSSSKLSFRLVVRRRGRRAGRRSIPNL